jgi:HSP20 family protein
MTTFYKSYTDLFDRMFKDVTNGLDLVSSAQIYNSKFPPCDIYFHEESKDLEFQFALAGYPKDEIDLSFEDDAMLLSLGFQGSKEKSSEEEPKKEALMRGIKRSQYRAKYFVPFAKYNVEEAKAEYKDGILTVHIPAKEESKPKKLQIT